jgi:hypothetical protein
MRMSGLDEVRTIVKKVNKWKIVMIILIMIIVSGTSFLAGMGFERNNTNELEEQNGYFDVQVSIGTGGIGMPIYEVYLCLGSVNDVNLSLSRISPVTHVGMFQTKQISGTHPIAKFKNITLVAVRGMAYYIIPFADITWIDSELKGIIWTTTLNLEIVEEWWVKLTINILGEI